jgi:putative SOS response-associated peptidase YedK
MSFHSSRNLPARYNICPTDTIDMVVEEDGKRDLVPMRWGLVPWWWKKRAKDAFKRRRCLIPAAGYYEWQSNAQGWLAPTGDRARRSRATSAGW